MKFANTKTSAFSLVEMLVVIAIIGTISAVAVPVLTGIRDSSNKAKNLTNARHIERMSASLASLGVAHVIPDSMGGVEATARLLREGVTVPEGPMAGESFRLPNLSDDDVSEIGKLLRVQYDMRELRLVMDREENTFRELIPNDCFYCGIKSRMPARVEKTELG
ncbi:MAG: type II secretion system protein [Verrucomicrobiales bacterium]|nr:type II secretion system protein [Verrucomicrobiales bacterium]